jgi:hypothetical protein
VGKRSVLPGCTTLLQQIWSTIQKGFAGPEISRIHFA